MALSELSSMSLDDMYGDLFTREYRTGREEEQFEVERAGDMERILYDMSYAEEARAIVAHLNALDRERTIMVVPECFVGEQRIYEALYERRRRVQSAGYKRASWAWTYLSTPRSLSRPYGSMALYSDEEEEEEPKEKPIEIWKRKIRIVRMLCGVCMILRKYAMEAGLMSNLVIPVSKRRHVGARGDIIDFNLDDYRVQKEIPVPLSTIELLDKPPEERSAEEVQLIARCMRNMPSFRKYTTEMQLMMSKIVRYMRCGKRRVVLRKGHYGYSVYFIFTGSVSVVMDSEGDSVFIKPEVVILRRGACFGEIALLQNTRRNATIVTAEECEFLVVDKEDFVANGIHLRMNDEFRFRLDFFRHWPSLETWGEEKVRTLAYCSRSEDFGHNKIIIKDSRKNEWLWFIVKGTCEVLKLVNLDACPDQLKTVRSLPCDTDRFITSSAPPEVWAKQNTRSLSRHRWKEPLSASKRPHTTSHGKTLSSLDESAEAEILENGTEQKTRADTRRLQLNLHVNGGGDTGGKSQHASSHVGSHVGSHVESAKAGMYAKVDRLRDGMCFGLDTLFESDETERQKKEQYSLISKGCTLIHVPKNRFLELADAPSLHKISLEVRQYPSEGELVQQFVANSLWDTYKQGLVEQVILSRINPKNLRDDTLEKYMEKKEQSEGGSTYGTGMLSHREQTTATQLKHRLKSAKESVERSARARVTSADKQGVTENVGNTNNSSVLSSASEAELVLESRAQRAAYRPFTCPPIAAGKRERLKMVLNARAQERDKWSKKTRKEGAERADGAGVRRARSMAAHRQLPISLKLHINTGRAGGVTSPKCATPVSRTGFKSQSFAARNMSNSATTSMMSFQSSSGVWESQAAPSLQSNSDLFGQPDPETRVKSGVVRRDYVKPDNCKSRQSHLKSKSSLFP